MFKLLALVELGVVSEDKVWEHALGNIRVEVGLQLEGRALQKSKSGPSRCFAWVSEHPVPAASVKLANGIEGIHSEGRKQCLFSNQHGDSSCTLLRLMLPKYPGQAFLKSALYSLADCK